MTAERFDGCENHVHFDGPFRAADALTWHVANELVRRHPKDLWVMRTYFQDGFYDLLDIRRLGSGAPILEINRHGTHVFINAPSRATRDETSVDLFSWASAFAASDARDWYRAVEKSAGLPIPTTMPSTTDMSVAVRFVAAFMKMQTGSRTGWTAWTEWDDEPTPGYDVLRDLYAWVFGSATLSRHHAILVGPTLGPAAGVRFAVTADGHLFRKDATPVALLPAYHAAGSSVTRLVIDTVGEHLP